MNMFTAIRIICVIFSVTVSTCYAQKTTRLPVSEFRGITITGSATEKDTLFMMMAQNSAYTHITDIIGIKHGRLQDIKNLLDECMKFLPEADGNTLEYEGNTIAAFGNNRVMLYGTGRDSRGYVLLTRAVISRLQTDIAALGN